MVGVDGMTHKISSDGAAVVAPEFHWLPIDEHTPRGVKMLLISVKVRHCTNQHLRTERQVFHPLASAAKVFEGLI